MIYITGDMHASLDREIGRPRFLESLTENDSLIVLGDYEEVGIEYFNRYMRYEDLTHQDVDFFFRKDDYLVYLMKYKFASYNNRYFRKEYM